MHLSVKDLQGCRLGFSFSCKILGVFPFRFVLGTQIKLYYGGDLISYKLTAGSVNLTMEAATDPWAYDEVSYSAQHLVDGNPDPDQGQKSCYHSFDGTSDPYVHVTFDRVLAKQVKWLTRLSYSLATDG